MTRGDRVVVALVLAVSLSLALSAVPGLAGEGGAVLVRGPYGEKRLDLSVDAEHVVEGALGPLVIAVEDGRARITEAPCPKEEMCTDAPAVDADGGAIVCLPSGVTVTSASVEDVDYVVR